MMFMKFSTLLKLTKASLELNASGRTRRYFTGASFFNSDLKSYLYTFATAMQHVRGNRVFDVNGEDYRPSDYTFFTNLSTACEISNVWVSKMAAEVCEPYHIAEIDIDDDDVITEANGVSLRTPDWIASFNRRFNENQGDMQAETKSVNTTRIATFYDFSAVMNDAGNLIFQCDNGVGTIPGQFAYLLGLTAPFATDMMPLTKLYNEDVMAKWIIWTPYSL
jgi:hypothetical protein